MNRIWTTLKDKKFRYGTLSTVMVFFAVAIFLLVNLVVGQFNYTRDLTPGQRFSISQYSKDYLANELNQDVTIYALFRTGQENLMLKQILEEYAAASSYIKLEYRDRMLNPNFIKQFARPDEEVRDNSIIVQSGDKHKIIPYEEMFTVDYELNYQTYSYDEKLISIDFEPQISKAIQFVTMDTSPRVYYALGSNEHPLPENLIKLLELENYAVHEIDLMVNEIPEDCNILLLTTPERDWSSDKANRILTYLQNEGRALFVMGYQPYRFTNLDNVLSAYGVAVGDYIVVEGDPSAHYPGYPSVLIPDYAPNEVTQPLIDRRHITLFDQATGVDELMLKKSTTTIEPIITTSQASYAKTTTESSTINKEPGDLEGPFNLGVMVTDSWFTQAQHTTKFIVYGCYTLLIEEMNNISGGGNWDLFVKSLDWLSERPPGIYIPSKSPYSTEHLQITQAQAFTIAGVSVVGMPLAFIIAGIVVWYRRRHN